MPRSHGQEKPGDERLRTVIRSCDESKKSGPNGNTEDYPEAMGPPTEQPERESDGECDQEGTREKPRASATMSGTIIAVSLPSMTRVRGWNAPKGKRIIRE